MNFPAAAQRGQGNDSAKNRSSGGAAKEFKFEVLSIKPVKRGPGMQLAITNPTPNGFTATAGMWQLLQFAYGPPAPAWKSVVWQTTEMRNQPGWVNEEVYAIDARVSQTDVKAWQNQNPKTHDLLHSTLRAVLKERFKLAVHEEPAQRTIFELVVAKRGPRLKPAAPGATLPLGSHLDSGGVLTPLDGPKVMGSTGLNFHGATMQDLADMMLNVFLEGPVRDRTGLTGRFDFQVPRVATPGEDRGYAYSVADLGLEFKRGTQNRPVLVIDHVERPTPN